MPSFSTRSWKPACPLRAASLALLLSLVSGCAQLTLMTSDDLSAEVANAREEKDFRTARYLIASTPETHPDYASVQSQAAALEQDIVSFEQNARKEILSLARAGNWQAAHQRLDEAFDRLPGSESLEATATTLSEREQRVEAQALSALLLAEGRALLEHNLQLRTLEQLTTPEARREYKTLSRRQQELAADMDRLGRWFAGQEDWRRTHDLLALSRQLGGAGAGASELERQASQALTSASYRKKQQRVRQQRDKAEALLSAYRQSGELDDLLKAREYISANSAQLETLDQEVTQMCQDLLRAGLSEGENLYALGNYQQAQKAWQRVLPISPGHPELNKKLERVSRVLDNLKALQNN